MMKMNRRRHKHFKDEGCCSLQFLKYAVCIFNTLFMISGAGILAVAIWTLIDKNLYVSLLSGVYYQLCTYVLLAAGSLSLTIGIVGCMGALKERRVFLVVYAFFLLLIFMLEAACGILAYLYEGMLKEDLEKHLSNTMLRTYLYDAGKTAAIDSMQQEFTCCGAKTYRDWMKSKKVQSLNISSPDSCCRTMTPGCAGRDHPSNIYHEGCIDSLHNYLQEHLMIIGAVGLGICILQVFGIVLSCCLSSKIKQWNKLRLSTNHANDFY